MLRKDGLFFVYVIQHQWQNKGEWVSSIENEKYFTPSNDCWQETGINGTFDLIQAKKTFKDIISKPDKNRKFRLILITLNQQKDVILKQ